MAHQNFSRVCTTYLLRHFRASPGRLGLARQSNRGHKRLHTLNQELIQHHPCLETRTSPRTQPLSSGPPCHNSRPPHFNPFQRSQTRSGSLRQSSPSASASGKQPCLYLATLIVIKTENPIVSLLPLYSTSPRPHFQHPWYDPRKMGIYSGSRHLSISRLYHPARLTEHQLSAQFRPYEIRDFHAVFFADTNLP